MQPKLVMCNIFSEIHELKQFAGEHCFSGIDWSFDIDTIPLTPSEESEWVKKIISFNSIEVRYHCPFHKIDLGHGDPEKAEYALSVFRRLVRLISRAGGRYLSVHVGLGRDSTAPLSWEDTIINLGKLVRYGADRNVKVCLENLAWGWSSKPNLFEKLIRKSGAGVTIDIGHAAVCESVKSQQYGVEDFLSPHPDNIVAAHLYDEEVSGVGHIPPENLSDIEDRLDLLMDIGCKWWVIEIREVEGLLKTKEMIDEYFNKKA